ncbi:MAG: hypothetical protein LUP95_05835, partial [Euryarchaeota archaeon]|nr:hypothetical protein [Euryarchaeota archaeon]
ILSDRESDRTVTGVRYLIKTKGNIANAFKSAFLHFNHQNKKWVGFRKAIVVPYQNWVTITCDRAIS